MNANAMQPFGAALLAFMRGEDNAELILHREDGQQGRIPAGYFFREPAAFTAIEKTALEHCHGHVLDAGAGTGLHSLVLQQNGLRVTAIDIDRQVVEIMQRRGVTSVHCADIFEFHSGPFDTLLMLGHGIGMVETIAGLRRFLAHASRLIKPHGQCLLDSLDVTVTQDPVNLSYHQKNRQAGRYIGEIRMQFEHQGMIGPPCGWLHVDAITLQQEAEPQGWSCKVICAQDNGEYLARLTPKLSDE